MHIYLSGNRVGAKGVVAVAQCVLARGTMAPTVQYTHDVVFTLDGNILQLTVSCWLNCGGGIRLSLALMRGDADVAKSPSVCARLKHP